VLITKYNNEILKEKLLKKREGVYMKKTNILVSCLVFLFVTVGTVYGGWKDKIAKNQIRVKEYIIALQKGADPDKISRPDLRRDEKSRAKAVNRELRETMIKAEKLARNGKASLIKEPTFSYQIVSKEYYEKLEKEYYEEKK